MRKQIWVKIIVVLLLAATMLSVTSVAIVAKNDMTAVSETSKKEHGNKGQHRSYKENQQDIINRLEDMAPKKGKFVKNLKESKGSYEDAGKAIGNIVHLCKNSEIDKNAVLSIVMDAASIVGAFVPFGSAVSGVVSAVLPFFMDPEPSEIDLLKEHLDEQFEIVNKGIADIRKDISNLSDDMNQSFDETVKALKDAIEAQAAGDRVYAFTSSGEGNFDYTLFKNYFFGLADASNPLAKYAYADRLTQALINGATDAEIEAHYHALYQAITTGEDERMPYIEILRQYMLEDEYGYSIQRYYYEWLVSNRELLEAQGKNPEWEAVLFTIDLYQTLLYAESQLMACNNYFLTKIYETNGVDFSDATYVYTAADGSKTVFRYSDLILENENLASHAREHTMLVRLIKDVAYILNMENSYTVESATGALYVVENVDENTFGQLRTGQTVYMNQFGDELCDAYGIDPQLLVCEWTVNGTVSASNTGVFTVAGNCKSLSVTLKYEGEAIWNTDFTVNESLAFSGGDGSEEHPFLISYSDQFNSIVLGEEGRGIHYQLVNDVNFSENEMGPIGNAENVFEGMLDGNGYAIQNLEIERNGTHTGLFAVIGVDGAVRNLVIQNLKTSGYYDSADPLYLGAIAGKNEGTIENCHLQNSSIELRRGSSDDMRYQEKKLVLYVGGIAGICCGEGATIRNCSVIDTTVFGKSDRRYNDGKNKNNKNSVYVGGIVAQIDGNALLQNCVVEGESKILAEAYSKDEAFDKDPHIEVCAAGVVAVRDQTLNGIKKVFVSESVTIKATATNGSGNRSKVTQNTYLSVNGYKMPSRNSISLPSQRLACELSYALVSDDSNVYDYHEDFLRITDVYYQYICSHKNENGKSCLWVYDEALGYASGGVSAWTKFEDLPSDFQCPDCGSKSIKFLKQNEETTKERTCLSFTISGGYTLKSYEVIGYYGFDTLKSDKENGKVGETSILILAYLEDSKQNLKTEILRVDVPYTVKKIPLTTLVVQSATSNYEPGDPIMCEDVWLEVTWADGTTQLVHPESISCESATLGISKITVTYLNMSGEYSINVACVHTYGESIVVEPTCLDQGYTMQVCTKCSEKQILEDSVVEALGHTHEVRGQLNATCTEQGYSGDTYCSVCEKFLERGSVLEKAPHEYEGLDATQCKCKLCHGDDTTKSHEFTSQESEDKIRYTCVTCGYTNEILKKTDVNVPRVVVGNAYGIVGSPNEIVVYVKIFQNPGIAGAALRIDYDDRLEYVRYERGDLALDARQFEIAHHNGVIGFVMADAYTINGNGNLIRLVFRLPSDAQVMDRYDIKISYTTNQFADGRGDLISIVTMDGYITAVTALPGDVNYDGCVDILDTTLLARYVAKKLTVEDEKRFLSAADVNLDGNVNISDLVILLQYLVGINEKEVTGNEFEIILNPNNGVFSEETDQKITVQYYKDPETNERGVYPTLPIPTRDGYRFDGWYLGFGQDAKQVKAGDLVSYEPTYLKQVLYAHWTEIYTVVYDPNHPRDATSDVVGDMESSQYAYGEAKPLSRNQFTLKGWRFTGWKTADGTFYADGQQVSALGRAGDEIILYAQWEPITYQVQFHHNKPNHATGLIEGHMNPMANLKYDSDYDLSLNAYAIMGWTFVGWSLDPNGTAAYADKAEIRNLTDVDGKMVTLYAVWEANEYQIVFVGNQPQGASAQVQGAMANQVCTYDESFALSKNAYALEGWTFKGWSTSSNGKETYLDGQDVKNLTAQSDGVYTLYAVWERNTYTVQFHQNKPERASGTVMGTMANQIATYDSGKFELPDGAYTLIGWIFEGWSNEEGGTVVVYQNKAEVENLVADGVCHLYAVWMPVSYTVKYDSNGGAGNMAVQSREYDDQLPLTSNGFEKSGYEFMGWNTKADGSGVGCADQSDLSLCAENGGIVTLYAQWSYNQYVVHYDANGGSGSISSQTYVFGNSVTIAIPSFERVGYTFIDWNTEADGTGKSYQAGETVVSGLLEKSSNIFAVTLYAQWKANQYIVTFDANGGSVSESERTVTYDAPYGELPKSTRPGYTFGGWYCNGTQILATDLVNIAENHTLEAKWTADTYSVTFYDVTGIIPTQTKVVLYDAPYGELPIGEREGYTFGGWYYNGIQILASDLVKIAENHTLEAKWIPNSYVVTFDANGGSVSESERTVTFDVPYGTLPEPERIGYTFGGWYCNGTQVLASDLVKIAENHTLEAKWTAKTYKVTFHDSVGIISAQTKDVLYGAPYGELPIGEREGYTFGGWYYNGIQILASDLVNIADDHTLEAKWIANRYQVIFNANEGIVFETNRSVEYDQAYGKLPEPTRTGYVFLGWYTSRTGGTQVTAETIHTSFDITLYARWRAITYTVHYYDNQDLLHTMTCTYGVEYGYDWTPSQWFIYDSEFYYLDYWTVQTANGVQQIRDHGSFMNLSSKDGDVVKFYANVLPKCFKLVFNPGTPVDMYGRIHSEGSMDPITVYAMNGYVELPQCGYRIVGTGAYASTSWEFVGWKINGRTISGGISWAELEQIILKGYGYGDDIRVEAEWREC